ncbi:MAG TPA: acetyl/propionyl-CoA carboxylase subunit alpha, partial [Microbacterium sp.]|nr:acetyl/propionyl-CoA carboxylase subunit alpha [Microbacterium sp.]
TLSVDGAEQAAAVTPGTAGAVSVRVGDRTASVIAEVGADRVLLASDGAVHEIRRLRADHRRSDDDAVAPELVSPMPGVVILTPSADGATVAVGDPVVVVEAMKMEHVVRAEIAGVVSLRVRPGDSVTRGQSLAVIAPPTGEEDGA